MQYCYEAEFEQEEKDYKWITWFIHKDVNEDYFSEEREFR